MSTASVLESRHIKRPINLASASFNADKYAYYAWLRDHAPVYKGKVSVIGGYFLSRYDDCVQILKDPRFVRNRTTATGGGRMPFPMPKSIQLLMRNMILEDDPEHRRLRNLVHRAFTPRALAHLEQRVEEITHDLLDAAPRHGTVDLIQSYALPIPVTVIQEMMGVDDADMPHFRNGMKILSTGMSGVMLFRTMAWDMPKLIRFVRGLIARKRLDPGDDILTRLIEAEDEGQRLSEDELISMVFLLIFAGFETTVHLIANSVVTLLDHPDQLDRLRREPDLMESAVEEVLRYRGPVQGTKFEYAMEPVTLHGVTIPKGATIVPLLGAANHDPRAFPNPEVFDITRAPNKHLGFGHGIHYCLGAPLARLESRIALRNLLARHPDLRLAVPAAALPLQRVPLWHRYRSVPVHLG